VARCEQVHICFWLPNKAVNFEKFQQRMDEHLDRVSPPAAASAEVANMFRAQLVKKSAAADHRVDAVVEEVVPGLVELEVAVPRSRPAVW
jgi:hypothetical protein